MDDPAPNVVSPGSSLNRLRLGFTLLAQPTGSLVQLGGHLAQPGNAIAGRVDAFLFQPVYLIHCFHEIVMGLCHLLDSNYWIVVEVSDLLSVSLDCSGIRSYHVAQKYRDAAGPVA